MGFEIVTIIITYVHNTAIVIMMRASTTRESKENKLNIGIMAEGNAEKKPKSVPNIESLIMNQTNFFISAHMFFVHYAEDKSMNLI
jgi:hypothetical protein